MTVNNAKMHLIVEPTGVTARREATPKLMTAIRQIIQNAERVTHVCLNFLCARTAKDSDLILQPPSYWLGGID